MDMQVPPTVGPNGPQSTSGQTPTQFSHLDAVPKFLSSVPMNANLTKFEKLTVALMAMAKMAKKSKKDKVNPMD